MMLLDTPLGGTMHGRKVRQQQRERMEKEKYRLV